MILQPVTGLGAGGYEPRTGIDLVGVKNGANPTFTTPSYFIQDANQKISVFWNGRRLKVDRDFIAQESGGAGTGYDTVYLNPWQGVSFLPRTDDELVADYYVDPNP